jgi:hypothetical protein
VHILEVAFIVVLKIIFGSGFSTLTLPYMLSMPHSTTSLRVSINTHPSLRPRCAMPPRLAIFDAKEKHAASFAPGPF